jgi:hypothetical protein
LKIVLVIVLLAFLAACANGAPPPIMPSGPWHQLNDFGGAYGSWTPTPDELKALPK